MIEEKRATENGDEELGEAEDTPSKFGFPPLDAVQTRLLGVLIEKQLSTPDYYPLTLKSTVAACNQKSNRDPHMDLDERTVCRGLDHLREKKLIWMVHAAGSRTPKYEHKLDERIFVSDRGELAVLAELLARGPQTPGQLRSRTERMHSFTDKEQVQAILDKLAGRGVPLVMCLGRQHGQKEDRYTHLLAGLPDMDEARLGAADPVHMSVTEDARHLDELEKKVADLEEAVATLQAEFAAFREQFE
ncbi:MAG: YceH family protein [Lentisphaeria bacterium]|nr:YceH family protein [Lentisphaeria bacterium]